MSPNAVALGLILSLASPSAASSTPAAAPPSSLEPEAKSEPVRIVHRHRAVRECVELRAPPTCLAREVDADTATVVTFERVGVTKASLDARDNRVRVTFNHRNGVQEQAVSLAVGTWVIDWPGAGKLERLQLEPGSHPQVTLTTSSLASCQRRSDRCQLVPGARVRRIAVNDGERAK